MSTAKASLVFCTVFWGKWHTDAFARVELPSLLSRLNLQALIVDHAIEFRILTTRKNHAQLKASPAFALVDKIARVQVIEEEDFGAERRFAIHHRFWNACIDYARSRAAQLFLLPPDLCFSDGSIGEVARRFAAGKSAVYVSGVRVVSETFIPAVIERFFPPHSSWQGIAPPDLDRLAVAHSHPFNNSLYSRSLHAPLISEMVLYPAGSDGWIKHCFVAGPIMFLDPRRVTLNRSQVVTAVPGATDFDVVFDSREAGFVSLSPLGLYGDWYIGERPESDFRRAWKQAIRYASPASEAVSRSLFRLGGDDAARASLAWTKAEQEASRQARRIDTLAILIEMARACERYGLSRAAGLAALVAASENVGFTFAPNAQHLCALPSDDAFAAPILDGLTRANGIRGLADFLARNIYVLPSQPQARPSNLLGEDVELDWNGRDLRVGAKAGHIFATVRNIRLCRLDSTAPAW